MNTAIDDTTDAYAETPMPAHCLMRMAQWCLVLGILLGLPLLSHASQGRDQQAIDYQISAGDLEQALTRFADLSGAQLFYSPSLVRGKTAAPLQGRMSHHQALAELLSGSGLSALSIGANTYLLQTVPAPRRPPAQTAPNQAPTPSRPQTPTELQGLQVTGTRIPRISLETTLPITLITREQIQASGFTTLFDLLRHQPGMTGHHALQASTEPTSQRLSSLLSVAVAQSSSLYELGPRATLYLVDGKRSTNYGLISSTLGGLTDLGGIPLSMVERVEIIRGGASAIYGSDAMAGVVNIILKRDYRGGELSIRSGISERGDADFRQWSANGGFAIGRTDLSINLDLLSQAALEGVSRPWHTQDRRADGLKDMTTPLGFYHRGSVTPLQSCQATGDPSHPSCRLDRQRYRDLIPETRSRSLHARWRAPVADNSEGYIDVLSSHTRTRVNNAPMTLAVPVKLTDEFGYPRYGRITHAFYDLGPISSHSRSALDSATLGFNTRITNWELGASVSRHRNQVTNTITGVINLPRYAELHQQQAFYHLDGRHSDTQILNTLSPPLHLSGGSTVDLASVDIEGPLWSWPDGDVMAAIGVEGQRDQLDYLADPYFEDPSLPAPVTPLGPNGSSKRTAVYAELSLPLPARLHAEVAWRLDHVAQHGSSSSPRLGLLWKPGNSWLLRAGIGHSFRAPSLYETGSAPASPYPYVLSNIVVSNRPPFAPCDDSLDGYCLLPVMSERNPQLEPEHALSRNLGVVWAPHERLNISIDYFNIVRRNEIAIADPIAAPGRFPETYVRDDEGVLSRARVIFSNIGRSDVRGLFLDGNWRWLSNTRGDFEVRVSGQHLLQNAVTGHPGGRPLNQAGYLSPASSMLASLQWSRGHWTGMAQLQHFSSYRVHAAGQPCPAVHVDADRCKNPPLTQLALGAGYSGFEQWTLAAHLNNLLDKQPVNYTPGLAGYQPSFDDPIGRYYLLRASYRF